MMVTFKVLLWSFLCNLTRYTTHGVRFQRILKEHLLLRFARFCVSSFQPIEALLVCYHRGLDTLKEDCKDTIDVLKQRYTTGLGLAVVAELS
jgi:hypothetical protein